MKFHILGLGSVGIVTTHLLRRRFLQLPIYCLPRRGSNPPNAYTLTTPEGEAVRLTDIVNDSEEKGPIDLLLITTKAHQTREALSSYTGRLGTDTLLIFLQNGMGIVDSIRDILPSRRIVLGATTLGAFRTPPNQVTWVYRGETLLSPEPNTSLTPEESDVLSAIGQMVSFDDLERQLYRKLAINASINPVTAIFNVRNSVVADKTSAAHDLAMRLVKEIQHVYREIKVDMDVSKLPEEVIRLATLTGDNTSSMLADVRAGVETEIDFINGNIVNMGHRVGVDVHENEIVVSQVKELKK